MYPNWRREFIIILLKAVKENIDYYRIIFNTLKESEIFMSQCYGDCSQ